MKYEVLISGKPKRTSRAHADRPPISSAQRVDGPPPVDATVRTTPPPAPRQENKAGTAMHRFPPILQILTQVPLPVQQELQSVSMQAFRDNASLEDICKQVYNQARTLGYDAVMGVQEVFSSSMPSFPSQTVMSALIMVDLVSQEATRRPSASTYQKAG